MIRKLLIATLLLTASPVLAKPATRDFNGHLFCSGRNADLRETADGKFAAWMAFTLRGDNNAAIYPPGGRKLFAPQTDFNSQISFTYAFVIDKTTGQPVSRPEVIRFGFGVWKFSEVPEQPYATLSQQLIMGSKATPIIPVTEGDLRTFSIYGLTVDFASDPQGNHDLKLDARSLEELAQAAQSQDDWIVLRQSGREIARIPVHVTGLVEMRDAQLGWIRRNVTLLAKGQCE